MVKKLLCMFCGNELVMVSYKHPTLVYLECPVCKKKQCCFKSDYRKAKGIFKFKVN